MIALDTIRVLYRDHHLSLWGIPHDMREGQAPRDLWNSTTYPDDSRTARGHYGYRIPAPGPREGWVWLGSPGWWGSIDRDDQARVAVWLVHHPAPGGPSEWCRLADFVTET